MGGSRLGWWTGPVRRAALALACALGFGPAAAQFNMVPPPQCPASAPAAGATEEAYRQEAAQHLYQCFPVRVYLGALPPLVYGVMTVEAQIDETGRIAAMNVVRKPVAEEIEPWLLALIRRAAPFPAPLNLPGKTVRFVETFFVDRSGLFQTRSLIEARKSLPPADAASPPPPTTPR